MTVKPISPIDDNSKDLSLKVGGDLGDLQISTPSDCEDDDTDRNTEICSRSVDSVSNIPSSLLHTSNAPIFGNVAVANSKNVHLGNNTHFHGPVTIKQIIHSKSGVDNASYTKTDEDATPPEGQKPTSKTKVSSTKKYHIHLWHKVVIIATCVIVVAVVFTLVFLQSKTSKSHNSSSNQESDTSTTNTLIAPNHLRIVSRTDWLAQPPDDPNLDKLRMPVPWVIIAHTATENCYSQTECVLRVRLIQMFHMESRKWDDIGYNFLVGGDGSAYYGRGWDIQGAHTLGYNKYSIGIGFVGTFNNVSPSDKQLEACKKLLQLGVQLGKLSKDYKLLAHRQLQSTLSPGDKLYNIIKTWPHFVNDTSDLSSLIPPY
ncbi:peptidoglycan-recognition protein LE-like isoform X3 [Plodia interpunctella]|uniref:peptidoglycan-recognition protein LE-like isoform X3 n=1 Tax=Plodia interpunctella TaxID=58824 RepID=UPI0023682E36|nr:peptidoglycan-recognition protein LE-like isoform X3 [Plodia interpunctella]